MDVGREERSASRRGRGIGTPRNGGLPPALHAALKSDVKYRFVIDMQTLKDEAKAA